MHKHKKTLTNFKKYYQDTIKHQQNVTNYYQNHQKILQKPWKKNHKKSGKNYQILTKITKNMIKHEKTCINIRKHSQISKNINKNP